MSQQRSLQIAKFNEIDDTWVQTGGIWTRCVCIGMPNNPASPIGVGIRADREIGDLVAGKKSFSTATLTVVLSGSVMHDNKWMLPGDIYVSPPHHVSGDLLFGPEGATIFIMFQSRSGMVPTFADPRDQFKFDELLRKDVEALAEGRSENSAALLPLRDQPTVARAVIYRNLDEVTRYRQQAETDW